MHTHSIVYATYIINHTHALRFANRVSLVSISTFNILQAQNQKLVLALPQQSQKHGEDQECIDSDVLELNISDICFLKHL